MAWKPLAERLDDLPLVLAGPILRHTDPKTVTAWVALKDPATVRLDVLETGGVGPPPAWPRIFSSAPTSTIRLGERLHVTAVTASSRDPVLDPGTTYAYNLTFGSGAAAKDLLNADVLTGGLPEPVDISYVGFEGLPTFVLPPWDLNKVRLAHGSCRKPHDSGRDGLAILDLLIDSTKDAPEERPQQLFLTGDQIYAEEVKDLLLWLIMDAVDPIVGWREILPGDQPLSELRPGQREEPLRQRARLQFHGSGQLQSHIIGLAEFYLMYLFVWAQTLWPLEFPTHHDLGASRSDWEEQVRLLDTFRNDVPAVRRVLANVPTYMIFDDHDVTDDWYISKSWCDDVLGSNWGKPLVQNALIAYAIFQHWGNVPGDFGAPESTGAKLLKAAEALTRGSTAVRRAEISDYAGLPPGFDHQNRWAGALNPDGTSRLAEPNDTEVFLARHRNALRWDYVVTGPKYQVIVLDTRTWRGHNPSAPKDPPSMLCSVGFTRQLAARLPPRLPGIELTCVIAPTNPVGLRIIDRIQAGAASTDLTYPKSIEWFDYGDAWNFHEAALATLLNTLFSHDCRRVVLLSGDIHFGYAVKLSYWANRPFDPAGANPGPQAGVLAQLTASAFKNAGPFGLTKLLHTKAKQLMPERRCDWAGWNEAPTVYELVISRSNPRWARVSIPPGTPFVMELKRGVYFGIRDEAEQPDWCFRSEFATRRHAPGQSRAAFALPSPAGVDDALGWLTLYLALSTPSVVSGAAVAAIWKSAWFQEGTEIVGLHNVGIVSFRWPDAMGKAAFQDLYFWPTGVTDIYALGRYEVSLDVHPEQPRISVQPNIP